MKIIFQRLQRTDHAIGSRLHSFQLCYLLIGQYNIILTHNRKSIDDTPDTFDISACTQLRFGRYYKSQQYPGNRTMNARL